MSETEQEQGVRMSEGARLIADVCKVADRPFVDSVENNFAGYFNELVIVVKLRPDATDEQAIELQNALLAFFDSAREAKSSEFTWLVKFTRGEASLRSLFPGDAPRTSSADLEWTD